VVLEMFVISNWLNKGNQEADGAFHKVWNYFAYDLLNTRKCNFLVWFTGDRGELIQIH